MHACASPWQDMARPCRRMIILACIFLLLAAAPALPGELNNLFIEGKQKRTNILAPYDPMLPETEALFHFDSASPAAGKKGDGPSFSSLETENADNAEDSGEDEGADSKAVKAIVPENVGGPTPLLLGKAEWIKEGRFGGGLRFTTENTGIAFKNTTVTAVETWIKLEKLPTEKACLFSLKQGHLKLNITKEGGLELDFAGQGRPVAAVRLAAGRWSHISLVWSRDPSWIVVYLNGAEKLRLSGRKDFDYESQLRPLIVSAAPVLIGGTAKDGGGFQGVIDELRLDRIIPYYFDCDTSWVDEAGEIKPKAGRPWFRDAADLLLSLDFNKRFVPAYIDPELAKKLQCPREWNEMDEVDAAVPAFSAGVERQGFRISAKSPKAEYSAVGLALPNCGTLSFWMQPVNWDNDKHWNQFAGFQKKVLPLISFQQNGAEVMGVRIMETPDNDALIEKHELHPGGWTHVAITWNGKSNLIYLDGQPWPYAEFLAFQRKGWDAGGPLDLALVTVGESQTLLDDLRVYRRALSPLEIKNLAAIFDRRKESQPLPALEIKPYYNGLRGVARASVFPLFEKYAETASFSLALHRKDEAGALATTTGPISAGDEITTLAIKANPFGFGEYELKGTALDKDGKLLGDSAVTFSRRPPPWWETKIGKSDKAMPGWTPVEVKGNELGVALRRITLAPSGLPEKIDSLGGPVLSGAIQLNAKAGGKAVEFKPAAGMPKLESKCEARADFSGALSADGFDLKTTGWIEFDGFMWYTLTLEPKAGAASIDDLEIRIPYADDSANLMHWWSGGIPFRDQRAVKIGAVPSGEGVVFSSNDRKKVLPPPAGNWHFEGSFIPYMMLAGNQRGMAWFAENDQGWTQSMEQPAVRVERSQGKVELVLHVISESVRLDGPRSFSFGLHPIPVKPLEKEWRTCPNWGVSPDSFCGYNMKSWGHATWMYRHPKDMDWSVAEARRAKGKELEAASIGGFKQCYGREPNERAISVYGLYQDQFTIAAFPDHTREWGEQWFSHRVYTPEIVDYCAWIWNEWLKRGLAKGIYMDDTFIDPRPRAYEDGLLMAYKLPNGKIQTGFSWLGHREHIKRLRQASIDNNVPPHLCAHATHTLYIPFMSFFDVILDGEDFYQMPSVERDFMDSWPRDRLRFNHPEKWGLINTWLWWTGASTPTGKFPTWAFKHERAYAGALLAHDLYWTSQFRAQLDEKWLVKSQLCLDPQTQFVPYWNLGSLARHNYPDLTVCAWKRQGLCVVLLANWGGERLESEVDFDAAAMGFSGVAPEKIKLRDVDPTLLSYFDNDLAKVNAPDAKGAGGELGFGSGDGAEGKGEVEELEEKPTQTPAERKASDPDGKFEWGNGKLKCPVRRHDFRLFEFSANQ